MSGIPVPAPLAALGVQAALVYAVPLRTRFRGIDVREGVLLHGPAGWGEFCPFPEYDDAECVPWLTAALEAAVVGWPVPVREWVPVNAIVPAVAPERAHALVLAAGCTTAKVKVADHPGSAADDEARLAAVRAALGPGGHVRADANGAWSVDEAIALLPRLDRAAGGLQYVEQPCATVAELAAVRRRVDVPIAADESIRRAADPLRVAVAGAADVAVLKATPLGGVRRALAVVEAVADAAGIPCVVSSALETSVGLAVEIALAAALPQLEFACGLGTLSLLAGDVVPAAAAYQVQDGRVRVRSGGAPAPSGPALEGFAAMDRERVAWWARRLVRVAEGWAATTVIPSLGEEIG